MFGFTCASTRLGDGRVTKEISADLSPGRIVVLRGANGSGKTTLLKAILGLYPLARGEFLVDGRSVRASERTPLTLSSLGIRFVPQGRCLFPSLTVSEHVTLLRADPNALDRLDWFGCDIRMDERTQYFSGGEQRAAAVALALAARPRLLVLDEPLAGLAQEVAHKVLTAVRRQCQERGLSALIVEHRDVDVLQPEQVLEVVSMGDTLTLAGIEHSDP